MSLHWDQIIDLTTLAAIVFGFLVITILMSVHTWSRTYTIALGVLVLDVVIFFGLKIADVAYHIIYRYG